VFSPFCLCAKVNKTTDQIVSLTGRYFFCLAKNTSLLNSKFLSTFLELMLAAINSHESLVCSHVPLFKFSLNPTFAESDVKNKNIKGNQPSISYDVHQ